MVAYQWACCALWMQIGFGGMCNVFKEFWVETDGQIDVGGTLTSIIILALFMSVVASMGRENGARHFVSYGGPSIDLDLRGWLGGMPMAGTFGQR